MIELTLPGEDRTFGGKTLYVDLVPSSSWANNVRTAISARDWKRIRTLSNTRAHHTCELCRARPDRLETHERWSYSEPLSGAHGIQRLERIICLCAPCHLATHFGFASVSGRRELALQQLASVNRWDDAQVWDHIDRATAIWEERNALRWQLDLSIITDAGIALTRDLTTI
jgi:hypothetical protein